VTVSFGVQVKPATGTAVAWQTEKLQVGLVVVPQAFVALTFHWLPAWMLDTGHWVAVTAEQTFTGPTYTS
jgi:hypothetical protein